MKNLMQSNTVIQALIDDAGIVWKYHDGTVISISPVYTLGVRGPGQDCASRCGER